MPLGIHTIRPHILTVLFVVGPAVLLCQPSTFAIISPADGTRVRPGQTISVVVEVRKPYATVFLLGHNRGGRSWGPDMMQQATASPYRFSVTIPNDGKATTLDLMATGCVRPGECDDSPEQVSIVVEPVWEPSDDASHLVRDAPGVTVDTYGNPFLHRAAVGYPPDLLARGISGTVIIEITPDWDGRVQGTRVLSGPDELRKQVITSVLAWHLSRKAGQEPRQIAIAFDAHRSLFEGKAPTLASYGVLNTNLCFWKMFQSDNYTVGAVDITGISEEGKAQLKKLLPVKAGDSLGDEQIHRLTNVVQNFDHDLSVWALRSGSQVSLTVLPDGFILETPEQKHRREASYQCDPPRVNPVRRAASSSPAPTASRIKVPSETQAARLISRVEPEYPPIAKANNIQGTVHLTIMIGKDGLVVYSQVTTGNALLAIAAEKAVRQWVYSPTLVNGQPVEVVTETDLEFFLPK